MAVEKQDLQYHNDSDGSTSFQVSPTVHAPAHYTQTTTQHPNQAPPDYNSVAPQQWIQHGVHPYDNSAYPPQRADHSNIFTPVTVPQCGVWCSSRGGVLSQPDQGRVVISEIARYRHGVLTSTRYTYADELPSRTSAMLVLLVMCVFLSTPVSLICSIPGYYYISKCNNEAKRGDIPAARESYHYYRFLMGGLSGWFGIVSTLAITLGILYGVGVI